jgi:predicted PurR-regulated permease PerM
VKLGEWIGLFCFFASLYVLWQIRQLVLLAFTAVVIAIALNSLVRQVQKLGMPRRGAIPIVLTLTLLLVTLFILVIIPPFAEQFSLLIDLLISGIKEIPDRLDVLEQQLPGQLRLPDLNEFLNWATSPDSAVLDVFNNFFSFFNSSLQVILQLLLVLILSIMFLGNPSAYRNGVLQLFPSFYRQRADNIMQECEIALCNWLGGILINSVFIFALSFVGLSLLGIRLVLAHALLAGLLNFIPNIGPTLSVIFPAMVALLSPEPWKVIAVVVLYVIIQQIESYWLTPTVMARQVSLLPAFTLLAQIFFASIFGFLGLLLALPLAVVFKTWIEELVIKDILDSWQLGTSKRWLRPLIAAQRATEPPVLSASQPESSSEGTSEEI